MFETIILRFVICSIYINWYTKMLIGSDVEVVGELLKQLHLITKRKYGNFTAASDRQRSRKV